MAKGNGTTKSSSSASPKGLTGPTSSVNNRIGNRDSHDKYDQVHQKLGNSFALPVLEYIAKNYNNATGKVLPDDAAEIVFGRGAADGNVFQKTVTSPMYSNIKVIEAEFPYYSGGKPESHTFITGYDGLEQLRSFVKDVENETVRNKYKKLQYRWNHK